MISSENSAKGTTVYALCSAAAVARVATCASCRLVRYWRRRLLQTRQAAMASIGRRRVARLLPLREAEWLVVRRAGRFIGHADGSMEQRPLLFTTAPSHALMQGGTRHHHFLAMHMHF